MKNTFIFNNKEYTYVDSGGNQPRLNERRMELPIGFEFVLNNPDIIEVGNVTRHYHREFTHDVIDLYEKSKWPIWNKDILTWKPEKHYKAAISISTVEHTDDPLLAIRNIQSLANHSLITIPMGYKRSLDAFDAPGKKFCMRRINLEDNEWEQTSDIIKNYKYNEPFPFANGVLIIIT